MGKKGLGKFIAGAAVGVGLGILFAPKSGAKTREELKKKLDEFVSQAKEIDVDEVKKEFSKKVEEIKTELADMDKEKALSIAKAKGNEAKKKAQELVELAKEKGTPVLKKSAEEVLIGVINVSKNALKKLDNEK